jgi:exonuclease VII small subunit
VPVTAKLSKQLYDKLGHPVVEELVTWFNQMDTSYRQDLRDLNEINFARFDAKLEQRTAEIEAKIEQRATKLEVALARFEAGQAALEGRLLTHIAQAEARLARLTVVLWMGTLGTLIALLKL